MARMVLVVDLEGNQGEADLDTEALTELATLFVNIVDMKGADFVLLRPSISAASRIYERTETQVIVYREGTIV